MSARRPRHATGAERVVAKLEGITRGTIIAATVALAFIGGAWFGLSTPPEPTMPPIIRVVVQPEPQATDSKAQADAEVEAYNRGMEAGKFIGCTPTDIELKTR